MGTAARISPHIGRLLLLPFLLGALLEVNTDRSPQRPSVGYTPEYGFEIVRVFPHDPVAFTEGLAYCSGFIYEGTGLIGSSSIRKVRLESGEVVQFVKLPLQVFGEGITIIGDRVIQLTWQSGEGYVYDLSSFRLRRKFSYSGEGWGLATNGRVLFMSDGTSAIHVLDPVTFEEMRRFTVRSGRRSIRRLNELEYVEGELFANVWGTDRIVRISPRTGEVLGWIDLAGLFRSPSPDAVLNGIAYDSVGKRLFVTGKLWPNIFEIRIVPKQFLSIRRLVGLNWESAQ